MAEKNNVIECCKPRKLKNANEIEDESVEVDESRLVESLEVEKDHRIKLSLAVAEVIRRNESNQFARIDFKDYILPICTKVLLKHGCKVTLSEELTRKLKRAYDSACKEKVAALRRNRQKFDVLVEHLKKPISFRIPYGCYEKFDPSVAAENEELREKVQQGIQREQVLEERIENLEEKVENLKGEVGQGKKRERALEGENEKLKKRMKV